MFCLLNMGFNDNISPKELQCSHCFNWSYKFDQQGALLTFLLTSAHVQRVDDTCKVSLCKNCIGIDV